MDGKDFQMIIQALEHTKPESILEFELVTHQWELDVSAVLEVYTKGRENARSTEIFTGGPSSPYRA